MKVYRDFQYDTVDTLALWDDMQKLQEEKQLEPTPSGSSSPTTGYQHK